MFHISRLAVATKNIRNMFALSTNQITDILHFNDKNKYQWNVKQLLIG